MHSSFATTSKIRRSVIGGQHTFEGPFGARPIIYADSTASGKGLSFIEDYIRDSVLPFYANTHTENSATGLQTTHFREDARDCIRQTYNAPQDEYAVLFTGSGSTGAINKLANVLGISPLAPKVDDSSQRTVVFISQQEHHSNELLWRESQNVDSVVIPQDPATGQLDTAQLEQELIKYKDRPLKLGSFSAASNVTGILCDTRAVTKILRKHGALAAWDFAAAGPHAGIDMKGHDLDAIYVSTHKYVGGPGTPGLLVARRSLFQNAVPTVPGGGTVSNVWPHGHGHQYLDDIESREEGGTPAVVESIRAGLVLQLHGQVGTARIEKTEAAFLEKALSVWSKNPNIVILGNPTAPRVSIVSFLVKSPMDSNSLLHFNFIVALLNDLFGIQSRGGCSCAAPYGHLLLGMKEMGTKPVLKPGWTRLSFSYYMSQETVDYIITAVDLVAREGYKLLPQYQFETKSGSWTHVNYKPKAMGLWNFSKPYSKLETVSKKDLQGCLKKARRVLEGRAPTELFVYEESTYSSSSHFIVPEEVSSRRLLMPAELHSPSTKPALGTSSSRRKKTRLGWLRMIVLKSS